MGKVEFDVFVKNERVATFYDEDKLKMFLSQVDFYDGEIRIVPFYVNDSGERFARY